MAFSGDAGYVLFGYFIKVYNLQNIAFHDLSVAPSTRMSSLAKCRAQNIGFRRDPAADRCDLRVSSRVLVKHYVFKDTSVYCLRVLSVCRFVSIPFLWHVFWHTLSNEKLLRIVEKTDHFSFCCRKNSCLDILYGAALDLDFENYISKRFIILLEV